MENRRTENGEPKMEKRKWRIENYLHLFYNKKRHTFIFYINIKNN